MTVTQPAVFLTTRVATFFHPRSERSMYCYWTGPTCHKWLSTSDSQACSFPLPTLSLGFLSLLSHPPATSRTFGSRWKKMSGSERKCRLAPGEQIHAPAACLKPCSLSFFCRFWFHFSLFFVWWRFSACASGIQRSICGSGRGGLEDSDQIRWVYAPHGLKSCLLAPLLFCSPRFLFWSELICCAHLDSSEGLFGWDVCWKCRLGRVHASRAPKTPLLMRIRSLIMSLFFLFRGLFLAEFIRDTHFDSGEGYSGRGWGCKCDLGKFSSAPCTEFAGCLRAHVFCSLNL